MILLADKSVGRPIVERLRAGDHSVIYVAELDPVESLCIVTRSSLSTAAAISTRAARVGVVSALLVIVPSLPSPPDIAGTEDFFDMGTYVAGTFKVLQGGTVRPTVTGLLLGCPADVSHHPAPVCRLP